MSRIDLLVDNRLLQNIAVWIFIFLIALVSIQSEDVFLSALAAVLFIMVPVYINSLKIMPLFTAKKWVAGIILFILNILFFTVLGVFLLSNYFESFEWRMLYNFFGMMLLILFFSSSIKLARDSFLRRQKEKDAELKLLKAQLNPHFLFNTLNNLYGLSVLKSEELPALMLKLSDLLRYSLYETRERLVPLAKEIEYLENYISLEKIRLNDKTKINFQKHGVSEGKKIAPMLLIVYVENAFKHLGQAKNGDDAVTVNLTITENELEFTCSNTIDSGAKNHTNMEQGKSGIGLKNAKKRMELLYPDRHHLNIEEKEDTYNVTLKIKLS